MFVWEGMPEAQTQTCVLHVRQAKESAVLEQMEAVIDYMRSNRAAPELERRVQSYFYFKARFLRLSNMSHTEGPVCSCKDLLPMGKRPLV